MKPFTNAVRPKDVGQLIDLTVREDDKSQSMAQLQLEGVAAIYNILCRRNFAYLADEVGMGKTYQALSLAALLWNEKPDARVLFISPRQNLQMKWCDDYNRFFASNYRRKQGLGDDRASTVLFSDPIHSPERFDNLRSWILTIGMSSQIAPFLRLTSFMRPVYFMHKDSADTGDLWRKTNQRFRSWGLFDVKRPSGLSERNASEKLNTAFAEAVNDKLSLVAGNQAYFDLVIVDEAQCLRNPKNQTNTVFNTLLKGHVKKWLFMSATPAHGGPGDLPTILNHYPDSGEVLDPELVDDLRTMQESLRKFLVRRQRRYLVGQTKNEVGKEVYRRHDPKEWGVRDDNMNVLGTLAMGLVQKGLVKVLGKKSNRYSIGFLSSFESLQSSLKRRLPESVSRSDLKEEESSGDWHRDQVEASATSDAPDTDYIDRISKSFKEQFKRPLPHPKVDFVVERISPFAFGTDDEVGGNKVLIFTRRISTVEAICDRLMDRYLRSIENRVRRCWGVELDWRGGHGSYDEPDGTQDPEGFDSEKSGSPFREAMSNTGWLFRYRQTFRTSGRNSLFFEDGWLKRLCLAGGVDPAEAAKAFPEEIWAESWAHASHSAGTRTQQHRADRLRYLAVQGIRRVPHVFGLCGDRAKPWRTAYEAALHEHLDRFDPAEEPHFAPDLFTLSTLWTEWDDRNFEGPMSLPVPLKGANVLPADDETLCDELCRRQVIRTLLAQTFRLTDTVLDLYFSNEKANTESKTFPKCFLDWLLSDDPGARKVKQECTQWIQFVRLIVDSCLGGAGRSWRELAREETWPPLYNPLPVVGIVGGSSAHSIATKQFRTPSSPRVIVCTDTLKEGVDLHLFCDQVLHYGVAWTSGDLEQRVGRVDRFFSQIERRLRSEGAPPDVELHVGYPHVVASLESDQVKRVIDRQKQTEKLMDSPLYGGRNENRELIVGASGTVDATEDTQPYRLPPNHFPKKGRRVVALSELDANKRRDHYRNWYDQLKKFVQDSDCEISPNDREPHRKVTIHGLNEHHELEWKFCAALQRYLITFSVLQGNHEINTSGNVRSKTHHRVQDNESFLSLLVPTPKEGVDNRLFPRVVNALKGVVARPDMKATANWNGVLMSATNNQVEWIDTYTAKASISRRDRERSQEISLAAFEGRVHISSIVTPLKGIEPRDEWREELTEEKVRDWANVQTTEFNLGYLNMNEKNHLVFGVDVLYGSISKASRKQLIEETAWRADYWEELLTGQDQW